MPDLISEVPAATLNGNAPPANFARHRSSPAQATRAQLPTMAVFFVLGFIHASWSANLPIVRDAYGLSPIEVSFAMFALAGGGIFTTTHLGSWLANAGTRMAYKVAGSAMALSASLIVVMPTYWSMPVTLAAFGASAAMIDIAMNAEASHIEKRLGEPIMSRLHGMCSVGGVTGGAVGSAVIGMKLTPSLHMAAAAIFSLAVLLVAQSFTLSQPVAAPRVVEMHVKSAASRDLWLLGGVALICLVAEGAMYNWATIYMRDVMHATPAFAQTGYVVFCAGLAVARFSGDRMREYFGSARLVRLGASLACVGMILALIATNPIFVMLGFAAAGFGLANVVPVVFAATARVKGTAAAEALARVAGLGYIGVLLGPVAIGGIAQFTDLSSGLAMVAVCAALVSTIAPRILHRTMQ